MDAICGILGKQDKAAVKAMAKAMRHRGDACHIVEGRSFTVASSSPLDNPPCLVDGTLRDADGSVITPAVFRKQCSGLGDASEVTAQGAFAAVVRAGTRWWLIRDRLGVKPLYYAEGPKGSLLFASELKALLASGYVEKHLNLVSIDRYLTLRCVPGPESIIQGAYRVPPGSVLEYAKRKRREVRYAAFDREIHNTSRADAADTVRTLLGKALDKTDSRQMLWSAGIDCAALAALEHGLDPMFVILKSAWQNETWRARESARLLHLTLKTARAHRLTDTAFAQAAYHLDEPIADASVLPLWLIAEQAATEGSVFLSGHGADELLGGYPRYHFLQKAHGAKKLVPVNLLSGMLPSLPPNAFVRRGGRYLTSIRDNLDAYLSLLAVFDASEREELYTDTMQAAIHEKGGSASVLYPHFSDGDLTRNLLSLDLSVGLPDLLLAKCDRLMAAHGVSLEFPYLDNALVDFTVSLPSSVKYGIRSKPLLRSAMRGILPGRVRLRARRDFKIPLSGPAVRLIDTVAAKTLTQDRVEGSGLFRWPYVAQVMRMASHNVYRRRQFWALLMFFSWYRSFMES